jgi:hypothetical protein
MLDLLLLTLRVEPGFATADVPELAGVIGGYLSWLLVFMDGFVEQSDQVLRGAISEALRCGYESAVVVERCDEPSCACLFEVALPAPVRMPTLPAPVASSRLLEWVVQSSLDKHAMDGCVAYGCGVAVT